MNEEFLDNVQQLGQGVNRSVMLADELKDVLHMTRHSAENMTIMNSLIKSSERTLEALSTLLNELETLSCDVEDDARTLAS